MRHRGGRPAGTAEDPYLWSLGAGIQEEEMTVCAGVYKDNTHNAGTAVHMGEMAVRTRETADSASR